LGFEQVLEGTSVASVLHATGGASSIVPLPGTTPSIYRVDPALATPYSQQASAGLQYAPAEDMTASVSYLFVHAVDLPRTRNVNLLPPASEIVQPTFSGQRLNNAFDSISQLEDAATSTYNGLSFAFRV
jgi:hypothetical protein